jgi:hypothetical protein
MLMIVLMSPLDQALVLHAQVVRQCPIDGTSYASSSLSFSLKGRGALDGLLFVGKNVTTPQL